MGGPKRAGNAASLGLRAARAPRAALPRCRAGVDHQVDHLDDCSGPFSPDVGVRKVEAIRLAGHARAPITPTSDLRVGGSNPSGRAKLVRPALLEFRWR